ncbi:MAG: type II toxin-antitoxin system VapC family toxin [Chloroflexi bacterium]|nr:type II toxin-antitoxin system VapC family toxin [Chloroflexota bacterium]
MTHLVDSDWIADYLKGRPEAITLLSSLAERGLAMSLVSYGEIYEGIYYGSDVKAHERSFYRLVRWVDVLPLRKPVMRRFARIRGNLRQRGQLIGDPDILIAATAQHYDLVLVTRNLKDFQRIPDLKLY